MIKMQKGLKMVKKWAKEDGHGRPAIMRPE